MKRATNEEIRSEVLEADKEKDFGVYTAVCIGTLAMFAAICGTGALSVMKALEAFRVDIGGYWISGMPLLFPVVTGIAAGYHRRRSALGIHVGILCLALLGAASSYGYSVEVVYQPTTNCTAVKMDGDCYRPTMVVLYLAFGGAGLAASIFGLCCSGCACRDATKRINERRRQAEVAEHQRRVALQEAKRLEARKLTEKKFAFLAQSASQHNLKVAEENHHPMSNLREENGYVNHAMSQSEISTKL